MFREMDTLLAQLYLLAESYVKIIIDRIAFITKNLVKDLVIVILFKRDKNMFYTPKSQKNAFFAIKTSIFNRNQQNKKCILYGI